MRTTTVDTPLIETARDIVPLIREYSDEAEYQRRLSRPVVKPKITQPVSMLGMLMRLSPEIGGGIALRMPVVSTH